jgi:hypothetical protein
MAGCEVSSCRSRDAETVLCDGAETAQVLELHFNFLSLGFRRMCCPTFKEF